ncbi:MAG: FlgD immunoglobulin-like domain containing protein [Candidatus Zixiibacteriota bacterium]
MRRGSYSIIRVVLLFHLAFYEIGASQSQSQYALIRRPVFEDPLVWRLTKNFTWSEWGTQLFVDCQSVAQSYVMTPPPQPQLLSAVSFHLDNGWNRMLYQECLANWIYAFGQRGSGNNQFLWPTKLDAHALCNYQGYTDLYFIFVADASNNRIVKLRYACDYQIMDWLGTITGGGLDFPTDVDINDGGTFLANSDDYLWVLNGQQIKRFTPDGVLRNTYGTYGCNPSGIGNFCRPTAVVCGKTPFAFERFSNDNDIYVADDGNHRIVWLSKNPYNETITWNKSLPLPSNSRIADLETDSYGQVWAVDHDNGRIYKYTYDLYPLCYFGSFGTGDNQFYYPASFSNTGGYLGCEDAFVAEAWTDNSGGLYFAMGTDILDFQVTSSVDYRWHYINYTLIDVSDDTIKIYDKNNQLVKTLFGGMELSGSCSHVWDGTNQWGQELLTGYYRVVVTDSSISADVQTGTRVNGVVKEAWVHHSNPHLQAGIQLWAYQSGPDQATLGWYDYYTNEDGFTVYCDGCLCGTAGPNDTNYASCYVDSGLIPGLPYVYWVKAYLDDTESRPSNADTVTWGPRLLGPSVSDIFPLDQGFSDLTPPSPPKQVDTCDLEIMYKSAYPGHFYQMDLRLKNPQPICGFNFLIKLAGADVADFHTKRISTDSVLIGSNWVRYAVRECSIDTSGYPLSRFNSLSCRGQVADTASPHCRYFWVEGWGPPDDCLGVSLSYRTLFKFGVDAHCIPDSTEDIRRCAFFDLAFARLYGPQSEEIPLRYLQGELTVWWARPGDVNEDSLVNAGDVIYLINYLLRGGPRPCVPEAADVNASCVVDVGDVIYLTSYLYRGGPPPKPGCWHGKD